MKNLISLSEANDKVLSDIQDCIKRMRRIIEKNATTVTDGIKVLSEVRAKIYEELNQIQHEEMILRAICYLQKHVPVGVGADWSWNPRQTGNADEPDLRGIKSDSIVISAEITTSEKPQGVIDKRIQKTLTKLNKMGGKRFYFVRTVTMEKRARTKVVKNGYEIEVKKI